MNDIINKIRKYYHKEDNILEIIFDQYDGLNYYVRLDLDKKYNLCYLRSYNFDLLDKFDKNYINQEVLNSKLVDHIYEIIDLNEIPTEFNTCVDDKNICRIMIKDGKNVYNYSFNLFIPKELEFLAPIIGPIVSNLPHRLCELNYELLAIFDNNTEKYLYNKEFKFDINKGDLSKIFDKEIVTKGEKYYKEDRVRFVENINGAYYAIVHGSENHLYSVIINYNAKKKTIQLSCNCPCHFRCKHMYAVLKHIQNKEIFRFYKVLYLNEESDQMYDQLFTNNTYLCVGIDGDRILLMMPNGELHSYRAIDNKGKLLYKVIEDDNEHGLQKELDKIKS